MKFWIPNTRIVFILLHAHHEELKLQWSNLVQYENPYDFRSNQSLFLKNTSRKASIFKTCETAMAPAADPIQWGWEWQELVLRTPVQHSRTPPVSAWAIAGRGLVYLLVMPLLSSILHLFFVHVEGKLEQHHVPLQSTILFLSALSNWPLLKSAELLGSDWKWQSI